MATIASTLHTAANLKEMYEKSNLKRAVSFVGKFGSELKDKCSEIVSHYKDTVKSSFTDGRLAESKPMTAIRSGIEKIKNGEFIPAEDIYGMWSKTDNGVKYETFKQDRMTIIDRELGLLPSNEDSSLQLNQ